MPSLSSASAILSRLSSISALLNEKTGIQVDFQNERLTTVSAHNILNTMDVRGKKRKAVVDAVSAVLILEDYMNSLKV